MSYQVSGVDIMSEIPLTDLPEAVRQANGSNTVVIRFGTVPSGLNNARTIHEGYQVTENEVLVTPPGFRFLVRGGQEILVDPEHIEDEGLLRFYLLGAAFTALLFQRGSTPLHAGSVVIGGRAVAICALSGRGKSTLTAFLAKNGYPLITDDRLVLSNRDGRLHALPGVPWFHLTPQSIGDLKGSSPVFAKPKAITGKQIVPAVSYMAQRPSELGAVVVLEVCDTCEEPGIEKLPPFAALDALRGQINYEGYVRAMDKEPEAFDLIAQIVRDVPVYLLKRPRGYRNLPALSQLIENTADWLSDSHSDTGFNIVGAA